jgi:hypothetical protein
MATWNASRWLPPAWRVIKYMTTITEVIRYRSLLTQTAIAAPPDANLIARLLHMRSRDNVLLVVALLRGVARSLSSESEGCATDTHSSI